MGLFFNDKDDIDIILCEECKIKKCSKCGKLITQHKEPEIHSNQN